MSWVQLALGLIREAVGSEAGKEVINSVRGTAAEPSPQHSVNIEALLADHRAQIDRNLESVVRMLNSQNEKLRLAIRRQRMWNIVLAAGLIVSIVIALLR